MKTATTSVVLPLSPEAYWRLCFDPTFLRALYLDTLQYKGFEILELGDTSRKLRIVPKLNLPGPVEKLIGDGFAYEDHGALDRDRGVWTWRMVQPAKLAPGAKPRKDVISTRGTIRVEPAGDGKCRRTDEIVIEAKVFGLGGLIESSAEKEVRSAWEKEFALFGRWRV